MEQKIYSIIIPHYNLPNLLRRLLTTIPRRDDLQVIVVDDCSTEGVDELNKLKQGFDWVEWYDTGTNGGGGKARNIGLEHAIGKYLIFADADDYFNLCFAEALDRYKDSDFDIIYFAANSVDTDTYQNTRDSEWLNRYINDYDCSKLKFYYTQPWAKFINRSLVKKHGINFHETVVSNDVFFSTQVDIYAKSITKDIQAIYCWTCRRNSVSRAITPEKAIIRLHEDNLRRATLKQIGAEDFHLIYLPTILQEIYNSNNSEIILTAIEDCKLIGLNGRKIKHILLRFKLKNTTVKLLKFVQNHIIRHL